MLPITLPREPTLREMPPRRIISSDEEQVRFRYKDYREESASGGKNSKTMELSVNDFVRRVLLHVPEPGHKVVRSYGLYAGSRREALDHCRGLLGKTLYKPKVRSWQDCVAGFGEANPGLCPVCGARLVQQEVFRPDFKGETRKFPMMEAA